MKKMVCTLMTLLLLGLLLTSCGLIGGNSGQKEDKEETPPVSDSGEDGETSDETSGDSGEGKTVRGIINRIDDCLVLLIEEEYQVMDFGEGVTPEGFSEGDEVEVTYTGELGAEESTPVITAITRAE